MPTFFGAYSKQRDLTEDQWKKLTDAFENSSTLEEFSSGALKKLVVADTQYGEVESNQTIEGGLVVCHGRLYPQPKEGKCSIIEKLYAEMGPDCFAALNGEFTAIIYDAKKDCLCLVRDHFGSRPIYYREIAGAWFFSDSFRTLALIPPPTTMDRASLASLLIQGTIEMPNTLLTQVKAVKSGCSLQMTEAGIEESRYWHPSNLLKTNARPGQLADSLIESLREAVRDRMQGLEPPYFCYLSGGIDSTVISEMVSREARMLKAGTVTLSLGFTERGWDEAPFAVLVSNHIGSNHRRRTSSLGNYLDDMHEAISLAEERSGQGDSGLTYYLAAQMARAEGARYVFCGEGGDELFGGYPSWVDLVGSHVLFRALHHRDATEAGLRYLLRLMTAKKYEAESATGVLQLLGSLVKLVLEAIMPGFLQKWRLRSRYRLVRSLLTDEYLDRETWSCIADSLESRISREAALGPFNNQRKISLDCILPSRFRALWYWHQASQLVPTYPFMDRRVLEKVLRTDPTAMFDEARTKDLLRRHLESLGFPDEITKRRKIGFSSPLRWYKKELKEDLETIVLNGELVRKGVLRIDAIRKLAEFSDGEFGMISCLIGLEIWFRQYGDSLTV